MAGLGGLGIIGSLLQGFQQGQQNAQQQQMQRLQQQMQLQAIQRKMQEDQQAQRAQADLQKLALSGALDQTGNPLGLGMGTPTDTDQVSPQTPGPGVASAPQQTATGSSAVHAAPAPLSDAEKQLYTNNNVGFPTLFNRSSAPLQFSPRVPAGTPALPNNPFDLSLTGHLTGDTSQQPSSQPSATNPNEPGGTQTGAGAPPGQSAPLIQEAAAGFKLAQPIAQKTAVAAATQFPTQVYGGASIQQMAQAIDKIDPSAPPGVKFLALTQMQKMMAPAEKQQMQMLMLQNRQEFAIEMARYKAQVAGEKQQQGTIFQQPDGSFVRVTPQGVAPIPGLQPGAQKPGGRPGAGPNASRGREQDVETEIKRLDDEFAQSHPNATDAEKQAAHFTNRKNAEQQLTGATRQARSPANAFIQKYVSEHPDATADDISRASARYTREQAIERGFASGQNANQMRQLNTVSDHLVLMREAAEAMDAGDIPRANQVMQRLGVELGHPEITNFELGRDIAANEIVRLLTATGGTEADRTGMQDRFRAYLSKGQMTGAIDTATDFVRGRFNALEQLYARNDPARRKEFEEEMLTPTSRDIFAKKGAGPQQGVIPPRPKSIPGDVPDEMVRFNPESKLWMYFNGTEWVPAKSD